MWTRLGVGLMAVSALPTSIHCGKFMGHFLNIYFFIFGRTGSSLPRGLFSSCDKGGAILRLWCLGFSLQRLLLLWSRDSRHMGFSSVSTWLKPAGSRPRVQKLGYTGLVALQHVGLSQIKGQTHVPCTGRQILNP